MEPQPIPIASVRSFLPYLEFMIEIGAPVERWLEQCRLPVQGLENPESFIPTRNYWEFVDLASHKEGIEDLGIRLGEDQSYDGVGHRVVAATCSMPTMLAGLETFARLVRGEYSGMQVWLSDGGDDTVRLNLTKSFEPGTPGYCQTEWMGMQVLVKMVQLFTGRTVQPDEIALRSRTGLPPLAPGLYPDVRFRMGQSESYVRFSKELLSLEPSDDRFEVLGALEEGTPGIAPHNLPEGFPDSIQQILMTYLRDGYPSVDFAAELAGMSRRTFQRNLGKAGVTYSTLVDRARFDVASHLLKETDASSLEIAFETGYEDPSHFARRFRRLAGCSPREYRRQRLADLHSGKSLPDASTPGFSGGHRRRPSDAGR